MQKKIKYIVWDLKKITIKIRISDKLFEKLQHTFARENVTKQRQAD